MKKILKYLLLVCLFSTSAVTAQKNVKVWNDDSNADNKADTSLVEIGKLMYRKVVTVSYQPISQEYLKQEFLQIVEQQKIILEEERRQRDESKKRIEEAKMKIESSKSFYSEASKKLKWKEKKIDENVKNEPSKREQRIEAFKANPRRKGS